MKTPLPLSVVVLTFNEERNLPSCLESVTAWAEQTFIVDSGSTDGTLAIAEQFGARVVTHAFESHARQWQWALSSLPLDRWVLALDADQSLTPELREDITRKLMDWTGPDSPAGAYLNRRQIFRGRWIRHGGYYPKYLLKLFRRDAVSMDGSDLVDHHFGVNGPTVLLEGDLIEDNRNEAVISVWIDKHNRYAALQARQDVLRADVIRLGFLDGKEGFIFHFMQAWWYRLLVDINRDELRKRASGQAPASATTRTAVPR